MLVERYEQLRAVVLGRLPGSAGLGLGVLAGRGLAAWLQVWRCDPPPAGSILPAARNLQTPRPVPAGAAGSQLVGVLAAMALAHL